MKKGKGLSRTVELAAPLDVAELQLELDVLLEQLVLRAAADRLAEQLARGIQPLLADLVVWAGRRRAVELGWGTGHTSHTQVGLGRVLLSAHPENCA